MVIDLIDLQQIECADAWLETPSLRRCKAHAMLTHPDSDDGLR